MRFRSSLIAAAIVSCMGASAFAGNPIYDSWASHKPGTTVTMSNATEAAGQKTDSEITYTLKDVTPAKVTIEVKTTMTVMGNKIDSPAQTIDIQADGAAAAPAAPAGANAGGADVKTSEEKVTVAGKEYAATKTETHMDANGQKTTATVWTSKDVPGTTLKMESTSEGQMKVSSKMEVTKIDLK